MKLLDVKSKFDAEFRRISIDTLLITKFDQFYSLVESLHNLYGIPFVVQYVDPKDHDLLPINNDNNFARALEVNERAATPSVFRLIIERKGEGQQELNGYGNTTRKKGALNRFMGGGANKTDQHRSRMASRISIMDDFRCVSSIIDVDILPETLRRVKLMRSGDKPLGFYIRDGTSMRVLPTGIEKVPAVFISRLLPGGLAESTGLLAVNDEVIEVNGIEVRGKTLDQVTDMMVANSSNLIITVKPANQQTNLSKHRDTSSLHAFGAEREGSSFRSSQSLFTTLHDSKSALASEDLMKEYDLNAGTFIVNKSLRSSNSNSSNHSQRSRPGGSHSTGDNHEDSVITL